MFLASNSSNKAGNPFPPRAIFVNPGIDKHKSVKKLRVLRGGDREVVIANRGLNLN